MRIELARVICVFLMIYAHVNPTRAEGLVLGNPGPIELLRALLADGLGRCSVPLLSFVSGYLAWGALARAASLWRWVGRRWQVLYLPAVLWSGIWTLINLAAWPFGIRTPIVAELLADTTPPLTRLDLLFSLIGGFANYPLDFLRDLAVMALLTPLLCRASTGLLALVCLILLAGTLTETDIVLLHRPLIGLSYLLGLQAARCRIDLTTADRWLGPLALANLALLAGLAWFWLADWEPAYRWSMLVGRCLVPLLLWAGTARLGELPGASATLLRLRPLVFLAFCSHHITLTLVWAFVWLPWLGPADRPAYVLFLLGAPVLAFAVAACLARLIGGLPATWRHALTGGRAGTRHRT